MKKRIMVKIHNSSQQENTWSVNGLKDTFCSAQTRLSRYRKTIMFRQREEAEKRTSDVSFSFAKIAPPCASLLLLSHSSLPSGTTSSRRELLLRGCRHVLIGTRRMKREARISEMPRVFGICCRRIVLSAHGLKHVNADQGSFESDSRHLCI